LIKNGQEKPKYWEEACPNATLSTKSLTRPDLGHKDWWHNSISYRSDMASGLVAYLVIDRALGTGGSHFVSIDCPSNFAAALMLYDVIAILLPWSPWRYHSIFCILCGSADQCGVRILGRPYLLVVCKKRNVVV
jgi:hypothetical protein